MPLARAPQPFLPTLLAACALLATGAQAQTRDTLQLNASVARLTDSNLFRLSDSANPVALIGRSSAAENIGVTAVGLNITKAYSLQRLELDLKLVDYQYQNFDYLDFTARNYQAAWRWSLTPRFTGNLTTDRNQVLNSFTDFQNFSVRNQRTTTNTRFDGVYQIDGVWRALGGVARASQVDQQNIATESAFKANSADVGVRYNWASGSTLSYVLKQSSGNYLNRNLSSVALLDSSYSQTDHTVSARWAATDKTTASASVAHISRSHPNFPQRNYSGLNSSLSLRWTASAKTALTASWARELASAQTTTSNYTQTDRFSVGPVWQVGPKTVLRLRHDMAQRDYLGNPGLAVSPRQDTTRDTTLSFDWQPATSLTLSASVQSGTRTSSQPGLDYTANQANVSAQITY